MNENVITAEQPMPADPQQEEQNVPEQTQDYFPAETPQDTPNRPGNRHGEPQPIEQDGPVEQVDNAEEIRTLRGRVAELTDTLMRQNEAFRRMSEECSEFAELFPHTPLSRLPREVWENVNSGTPLSAAYALYQVKQQRLEAQAAEVNARNSTMSGGGVSGTPEQTLSPGEVRQMTPEQVRSNYSKILESMKLWS